MQDLIEKYRESSVSDGSKRPMRIAILDTGIDLNNPVISKTENKSRIIENRSFLPNQSTQDMAGHGTHVAGLILKVAPHADVCVARVFDNRHPDPDGQQRVAEVYFSLKCFHNVRTRIFKRGFHTFSFHLVSKWLNITIFRHFTTD